MKIAVYNTLFCTDYLKNKIDFEVIAEAITMLDADIVGLNEIYGKSDMDEFDSQTEKLAALTGYEHFHFAEACTLEEGTFGNAILSKLPFEKAEVIPVPEEEIRTGTQLYEPRCLLKVRYSNGLTVLVIHFGLNEDEHINAVKTVLENLEDEKCILMGDFNVTPDNSVLDSVRKRMNDTSSEFSQPLLSYPSDKPRVKIDYIFTSPDIEVVSADIPGIIASDHRPHVAEIVF